MSVTPFSNKFSTILIFEYLSILKVRRRRIRKRKDIPAGRMSRSSRVGGKRGCLCQDNTYHVDCCDGSLHAQGIGAG